MDNNELRFNIAKAKGWRVFYVPPRPFPQDYPYFDMTNDERRIGWHIENKRAEITDYVELSRLFAEHFGDVCKDRPFTELMSCMARVPNWPEDIAACYELEAEIPEGEHGIYSEALIEAIIQDTKKARHLITLYEYCHATPSQRCRAWLAWKQATTA